MFSIYIPITPIVGIVINTQALIPPSIVQTTKLHDTMNKKMSLLTLVCFEKKQTIAYSVELPGQSDSIKCDYL